MPVLKFCVFCRDEVDLCKTDFDLRDGTEAFECPLADKTRVDIIQGRTMIRIDAVRECLFVAGEASLV